MRIAYIDHSFHEKTESTKFIPAILRKEAEVLALWDESWKTGFVAKDLLERLAEFEPELVIFFQVLWPPELLSALGIREAVLIPMYDSDHWLSERDWSAYRDHRFISFSKTLAERIAGGGPRVKVCTYFPEVKDKPSENTTPEGLRGFYWHRSDSVGWEVVSKLGLNTAWESFFVHDTPDPGFGNAIIPESDCLRYQVEISSWFETRDGFRERFRQSDVFFSPRLREGIGMGFLEAMSEGCCVVAPDLPTHNEYIEHGRNGLLYDPRNPVPLDFAAAREIGQRGRETVRNGHQRWEEEIPALLEEITDAAEGIITGKLKARFREIAPSEMGIDIRGSLIRRIKRRLQKEYRSRIS